MKITRWDSALRPTNYLCGRNEGRQYYWMGGSHIVSENEEGTDVAAVEAGYVAITPIHMDLTNHRLIDTLRSWDLRF